MSGEAVTAICAHGCATSRACSGACQPAPIRATGAYCRYCAEGRDRRGLDHWIVQSIVPAKVKIVRCKAVTQ